MDDAVREFLATKPDSGSPDDPLPRRRRAILAASDELAARWTTPGPRGVAVRDVEIDGPAGPNGTDDPTAPLRLRVYDAGPASRHGVHVFLHGGGFWLGSVDEDVVDATCRERAATGCVVVSVEYRHAPEHPFPAAVEDGYAALCWVVENASALGVDSDALSVGGVSAGGTLAAALALAARDRSGPAIDLQVLEVPLLDLTLATLHASGVPDDYGLTAAEMAMCVEQYLSDPAQATDPLASPLLADDLSGLPEALVLTAELDPLRDDGARYAERLQESGVPATHVRAPGMVHGSIVLTAEWEPARAWQARVHDALRAVHGGSRATSAAPNRADRTGDPVPAENRTT